MPFAPLISSEGDGVRLYGNNIANLIENFNGFVKQDDSPKLVFRDTMISVRNGLNKIGEGPYDTYICLLISRATGNRVKFLRRKLALKPEEALGVLIKHLYYSLPGEKRIRKRSLEIVHGGPNLYWVGIDGDEVQILVGSRYKGEKYPNTVNGFYDFLYREDLSKRPNTCSIA